MNSNKIEASLSYDPFPHMIVENFYTQEELDLIWEELTFYTKPGKLLPAKNFGGIEERTNSNGICLDFVYPNRGADSPNYRNISNILTVNRKIFDSDLIDILSKSDISCRTFVMSNSDVTKVRYYHDGEYYEPHTDSSSLFLVFTYFYKEPKKFTGGELYFPPYDYEFSCNNNSLIIIPAYVEHGVKEVKIKDSDYYEGFGRYCISSFGSILSNQSRYDYM